MAGSVNICTVSLARTRLLRTLPKTASPAKSLPTIAMTWVVLAASTDRTEPSMLVVSRRQALDQKPRKSSSDIFENGVTSNGVSLKIPHATSTLPIDKMDLVRVLQYRSVAFVTYVSELSAQFAKEAMACQSLDNDEILNVRWATEDPNPTQKVAEKRRLEELGQEAIRTRMDPRIVKAMRAVRALEEGVLVDDEGEFIDDPNGNKRRRLEIEDGDSSSEDNERSSPPPPPPPVSEKSPEQVPSQAQPQGLLSADVIEGLQYFAQIRKKNGSFPQAKAPPLPQPPPLLSGGLGLGDYGSDEDD